MDNTTLLAVVPSLAMGMAKEVAMPNRTRSGRPTAVHRHRIGWVNPGRNGNGGR